MPVRGGIHQPLRDAHPAMGKGVSRIFDLEASWKKFFWLHRLSGQSIFSCLLLAGSDTWHFHRRWPHLNTGPARKRSPEWHRSVSASSLVSHDDGEEDWSKYDVPAFIRRGIPMPKLEVVQPKKPAKRKKAVKKSQVVAPTETEARFEVVL
ncbi:MAG: hypothetical protein IPL15_00040 [Comamonadaceae bacterium]|nr:hypothetical protein [Comamonadaceae bacterium]